MNRSAALCAFLLSSFPFLVTGCAISGLNAGPPVYPGVTMNGKMQGGQQPVSGATIQLYAVGTTDGGGAKPLLKTTVTSDANGGFTITGDFDCPDSDPLVYLVGTGGDPGVGSNNSAIGLMAALGHCSSLSASTFIWMDEVTTVAAAAALATYMTPPANVGAANANLLAVAFQLASEYADTSHGSSPGVGYSDTATPYQAGIPVATINTLANILASCVNSASSTSLMCSQLASLTGGSTDTLTAIVKVMQNPGAYDTAGLFALATATGPFQPQLSSAPAATFGVSPQPPSTDSSKVFAFPSSVSPGDAVWLVAKQYPPCLNIGAYNYLRLNQFVYTTGGTVQCGTISGIVPTNVSYGVQTAEWLSSANSSFNPFNDYLTYVTVTPKPTPTYAFKPNAAFWEGDGVLHGSYDITVIFTNYTSANVTMGTSSITGADAEDFKVTQTYCENATVYSSGGCSVNLQFVAPDLGLHFATFVMPITDQGGHVSYATVQLGGSGIFHYTGP